MKNCVRCGEEIENGLRCKSCREYVDDELNGGREYPLEFYFKRHKQNVTRNTIRVNKQTKDFYGGGSTRRA